MLEHILYCNETAEVLVLDLPTSIARAQASTRRLHSTPARDTPYSPPEPKGAKREALLLQTPASEREHHHDIQDTIGTVLNHLHEQWSHPIWSYPRPLIVDTLPASPKCGCPVHYEGHVSETEKAAPPLVLSPDQTQFCCSTAFINTAVHNPHSGTADINLSTQGRFVIPPHSTFLCATVGDGFEAFRSAVHSLLPRNTFDLILLDPPWKNRSVRNSRAYWSAESQLSDPFEIVFPRVVNFLSDSGVVGVWITNGPKVRAQVMEACSRYGLTLEEEWIWLKVTTKGEPISPIEGLWKKPYETALVFRRAARVEKVVRRLGIAVPDFHSRKPSLKSMFEQILPSDYQALEIFARSLTAGWWSWGDEVLRFQHESYWY